jgi:HPt (histidine-containing phosphotransfer) domain-containing protein
MTGNEQSPELKKYIDVDDALSRVRGNKSLYRKMLNLFLQNEEFDNLDNYLAEKDYEKAAASAHAIKGMTGNLSFTALFECSTELLKQLQQGPPDETTVQNYHKALDMTKFLLNDAIKMIES